MSISIHNSIYKYHAYTTHFANLFLIIEYCRIYLLLCNFFAGEIAVLHKCESDIQIRSPFEFLTFTIIILYQVHIMLCACVCNVIHAFLCVLCLCTLSICEYNKLLYNCSYDDLYLWCKSPTILCPYRSGITDTYQVDKVHLYLYTVRGVHAWISTFGKTYIIFVKHVVLLTPCVVISFNLYLRWSHAAKCF